METVSTWVCGKVYAGIQALKAGGNAADAAATTALTQVTMQSESVVS
jgi:gamma-glutamyltranspeptidase